MANRKPLIIGGGALKELPSGDTVSYADIGSVPAALSALAALTPAADRLPYYTSGSAAALTVFTSYMRTLLDDVDASTARGTLGLGTAATLNFDTDGTFAANSDSLLATQKATKTYVDTFASGLHYTTACRVATTANGTLASAFENGDTVDGVVLATGNRLLIKDQTNKAENGIYTVNASGAPTRATDADTGAELKGIACLVTAGTQNAGSQWQCTNSTPPTVGSDDIIFAQIASGAVSYTAGTGLSLTGNQFAVSDAELLAILGLTSAADRLPYFTGSGTAALATYTAFARTIDDDADAATMRGTLGLGTAAVENTGTSGATLVFANGTNTWANTQTFTVAPVFTDASGTRSALGLVIGTNVQAFDAELNAIAALTSAADRLPYFTGSGTASLATYTAYARTLDDDADATTARGTLGLGTAATQNTGTSGANVPLMNAANAWSARQTLTITSSGAQTIPLAIANSSNTAATEVVLDLVPNNNGVGVRSAQIASLTTTGSDASLVFRTSNGAVPADRLTIDPVGGVHVGTATGQGVNTFNAGTLFEGGVSLVTKYQAAGSYQPLDSELTAIAGLTSAADRLPYFTGSGTAALATFSAFARTYLDDADAATTRGTLGLGTAAVQNTGTSGTNVPLLDGSNTWSATQTVDAVLQVTGGSFILNRVGDAAGASLDLRADTSQITNILMRTGTTNRWQMWKDSGTEAGSNAGSDFRLGAYDDAGSFLGYSFIVNRATQILAFQVSATGPTPTAGDNTTKLATTAFVTAAVSTAGGSYQPLDAELSAIAGLTSAADRLPYFTGSGTAALATYTAYARTLDDDADATTARGTLGLGTAATQNTGTSGANLPFLNGANTWATTQTFTVAPVFTDASGTRTALGLVIGTNVQAQDAELQAIAGLTSAADKLPYFTGSGTASLADLSAFTRTLLDDTTQAAWKTTLGLVIGTNVQAWDADLDVWAGKTAPAGTVVGTTDAQALTNKTFDASANTLSNITTAMFAANVVDTDVLLAAASNTRLPSQLAIKSYVDNFITGLKWKASVACASVGNLSLTGEQTIDGVTTATSRILVKDQTTATQNGIYLTAAGAWARTTDADSGAELVQATVFVEGGTVNSDTQWTCTNNAITVGSTNIVFAQVSGAGTYTAGTGLSLTGNQFAISDAELLALLGLSSAADKLPYFTGAGTAALADFSAFARTLVDDANQGAMQTTLGLVPGTNVQAFDAELAAIAGLTSAADRLPYFTGSGTASLATYTAYARTLDDDADASTARGTLGLGTAATQNTGTSGATLPFANTANTWLLAQTFTAAPVFTDQSGSRTALGLGTAATQNTGTSGANVPLLSTANTWTLAQAFSASPTMPTATAGDNTTKGATTAFVTDAISTAGGSYQPLDAELSAIAGLTSAADRLPYFTGSGTAALTVFSAFARTYLDDADAATTRGTLGLGTAATQNTGTSGATLPFANGTNTWANTQTFTVAPVFTDASGTRTALGLVIGTNVQAQDAELQAIAGLTSAADRLPYFTGSGTASLATYTAYARTLDDDADATTARGTLGLGTAATQNTGTSGANLPFLNGANTWSALQTIQFASSGGLFLELRDTLTSGQAGPLLSIFADNSAPAADDNLGELRWFGRDSVGTKTSYLRMIGGLGDPTDTAEGSYWQFVGLLAGASTTYGYFGPGLRLGAPSGGDKGLGTLNAQVGLYEAGVALSTKYQAAGSYQPLDAELTAIAGLTSAADRLPYFSGSGTALLATYTAYARTLDDDADATTARGTLGLGTAATQNTGTSGANVPLLNGANTWSGAQAIGNSTGGSLFNVTATNDTSAALQIIFGHQRATPTNGDGLATLFFQGFSSTAVLRNYVTIAAAATTVTNTAEASQVQIGTYVAGTLANRIFIGGGLFTSGVTGGDKGAGTINAGTLYQGGTDLDTLYQAAGSYQPLDAELTAIAGLTSAADRLPYFTGSGTASLATYTAYARTLDDDADAATARGTLGLGTAATQNTGTSGANVPLMSTSNTWAGSQFVAVNGNAILGVGSNTTGLATLDYYRNSVLRWRVNSNATTETGSGNAGSDFQLNSYNDAGSLLGNVFTITRATRVTDFTVAPTISGTAIQLVDAELSAIAGLTSAADRLPYFTGSGTASLATYTAYARTLDDDADATTARGTLGLGTAATQNTGTSGATLPFANTANTWLLAQTFTAAPVFTDQSGSRTALGLGTAATQNTGTSGATLPFLNGANTWATTQTFTVAPVFTDQSGTRTALGLVIGTNVQAQDAELQAIAGLTSAADRLPYFSGSGTALLATYTAYARTLDDDADAATARGTLGLGTAATQNTGTSGATIPFLNGTNTWANAQTFSSPMVADDILLNDAIIYSRASTALGSQNNLGRTVYDLIAFRGGVSNITGAIVFHAPSTLSTIMHQMHVTGRVHQTLDTIIDFQVAGYKASAVAAWSQTAITHSGDNRPQVRWGMDAAGFNCLILGDVATVWPFPYIGIALARFSHSNATDAYCTGWTTTLETDLSAYTLITSDLVDTGPIEQTASLEALAALTPAADRLPYFTSSTAAALATFSSYARTLVDDADAATARGTLGLGTAAVQNTGTSGANLPFLNGTNTWAGLNTHRIDSAGAATTVLFLNNGATFSAGQEVIIDMTASTNGVGVRSAQIVAYGITNSQQGIKLRTSNAAAAADALTLDHVGGVFVGTATGGSKGVNTFNANTLYQGGSTIASLFQAADAELSAIAGLTSAADRLPYFTGSGTASLATYTAYARTLDDDADAATARGTLGLGTAATQNTGTSGTTIPFLDGTNSWSGQQTINLTGIQLICRDGAMTFNFSAVAASNYMWFDVGGSGHASDNFVFGDLSAGDNSLMTLGGWAIGSLTAPTAKLEVTQGSNITTTAAFTSTANSTSIGPWIVFDRNKGAAGAANDFLAINYYRGRNASSAAKDFAAIGTQIITATASSEVGKLYFQTMTAGALTTAFYAQAGVVVGAPTGADKGVGTLNATAVYDDNVLLTCVPLQAEFIKDGKVDLLKWDAISPTGRHYVAHQFSDLIATGFDPRDPRQYIAKMLADQALPGMPTFEEWKHGRLSTGEMLNKLWLAVEMLAVAWSKQYR